MSLYTTDEQCLEAADSIFFSYVAELEAQKLEQQASLERDIRNTIQWWVDGFLPKPDFVRPSLYNSEEDLDLQMLKYQAEDYVDVRTHAALAKGFVEPPYNVRRDWFESKYEELVILYCEGKLPPEAIR